MLTESIRAIYTTNLGVGREERVLVFTDRMSDKELVDTKDQCRRERLRDIALLSAEIGKSFARKVIFQEYPSTMSHGAEPPEGLWRSAFGDKAVNELRKSKLLTVLLTKKISREGIEEAEAIIRKHRNFCVHAVIALSNYSTSHTRFRDLLTRVCGARFASMPLFDASMFEGAMDVNWRALAKRTTGIVAAVNKAEKMEIRTLNGSHLSLSKSGRKAHADTGILTKPGSFGNLPAGEVYLAPLEGSANGELILEWAPTRELKSPVKLTVKDGFVIAVRGDESFADVLRGKLLERRENANIAELGIGTNEKARRPDNILESEKILGTIHIALGDNSSFGGNIQTSFHQDFVFFKPTVIIVDKSGAKTTLMKDGSLLKKECRRQIRLKSF